MVSEYLKKSEKRDSLSPSAIASELATELYIGGVSYQRSSHMGRLSSDFKKGGEIFVRSQHGLSDQFVENVVRRR